MDALEIDLALDECLYSFEEENDGFRLVPFDRWGRVVRLHPLRGAYFASPEEAFNAIRELANHAEPLSA